MSTHPTEYNAASIEVLTGLDPVKRRPGMYTNTSRPNHLAQEVIDNSADEHLAGYAKEIEVTLFEDNSIEVRDDGRGMPVDIHPEEGISGVELILTRLHAGGKFSNKNYQFSGGLHGVGISVVNALATRLDVTIKRSGKIYQAAFEHGNIVTPLTVIGKTSNQDTGTCIHFWPDTSYFDTPKFSVSQLIHILRAKAVLCPGLSVKFIDQTQNQTHHWCYENGLASYLQENVPQHSEMIPEIPFIGKFSGNNEAIDWALLWSTEAAASVQESYVNLIPTLQGGTHVNGLRTGLLDALRDFCEFRNLLPRGVKLTAEDIWSHCNFVLSLKIQEPQFSGQTKERLTSREAAAFTTGIVKDAFSLWLNQHVQMGEALAQFIIQQAEKRLKLEKTITRKKITSGPALPGKLADCKLQSLDTELFLVEGDSAGGSAKQARDKEYQAVLPLRGKILNTWEVDHQEIFASQTVQDIAIAIGVDPVTEDLASLRYGKICILADADSDGAHIATLLCALFLKHFPALVRNGHIFVAMPPLYRIDIGKEIFYALDEAEKNGILDRIQAERKKGKANIQRFKGLGEMNPLQLRETTMARDTRRLVQLTLDDDIATIEMLDMLLAKKRASDRKQWLEDKGDLAEI